MERYDIIIAGGGMVGMAAAIACATEGLRCAVIERIPHPQQLESRFDGRTSAIALGTKRLLAHIGAWDAMAPYGEAINDIRVLDRDSPLFLHYDHREVGDEPFGWILENRHIREALFARADALGDAITLYAPHSVQDAQVESSIATVTLDDGRILTAPLLVVAEGKFSATREKLGFRTQTVPYGQTAIVCTIAHSLPHEGLAVERFLKAGPFAILPMQRNRSSLVWAEQSALAPAMLALPEEEFIEEIQRRIGGYLGEVKLVGERFSYPLTLLHAERYTNHRVALIGDTAHGIHPIAGQGVNLGFRDVAVLAEILGKAKGLGLDIGFATVLDDYARWRAFDTVTMVAVTHGLTRLFSNDIAPLVLARRVGLAAVGRLPFTKRFFMRHAMGLEGDLPRLMREDAA